MCFPLMGCCCGAAVVLLVAVLLLFVAPALSWLLVAVKCLCVLLGLCRIDDVLPIGCAAVVWLL